MFLKLIVLQARYYACEGLYNVTKVARGAILLHFNEIFNALSKLAADPDQNVRSGMHTTQLLLNGVYTYNLYSGK